LMHHRQLHVTYNPLVCLNMKDQIRMIKRHSRLRLIFLAPFFVSTGKLGYN
jgi:hypothetical protein